MNRLQHALNDSLAIRQQVLDDTSFGVQLERVISMMESAFREGKKVLFCGNGGSAADAQHIAAELSGRFKMDRKPLFAEALHVNSSYLTAVANDYGYEEVFARMCEAMGSAGDVLIGLSTSGNSQNVAKAMDRARSLGMVTIALTGSAPGKVGESSDVCLCVPSTDTARIQEMHITLGHVMCEEIEARLFL
jgi:D-sedoheptulose 7-phosphate isomerase